MATNELVVYEYKSNTNDFVKNIDKAKNSEDRMSKSTDVLDGKTSKLGNTFTLVAGATGIALGVLSGAIFKTGLEFNAMQESTHKALTVLLESETAASDLEGELKKLADSSQFDLSAINGLGIALVNAGIGAEDVPGKVNDITDAVGALGGGTAELESVTRAIGQMYAKGKISAEEMNQLAEAGIPAWKLLSEAMGLSVAEVMKLGEQGKLTTVEIDLLVEAMGQKYEGGAAIDTFPEKLSNMKAQFAEFSGVIMKVFTPALTQAVDQLTIFFDAFDEGIPPEAITALENVAIGVGAITLAVASWSTAQLILKGTLIQTTKALILQGVAWAIINLPVILLTLAIFALGLAFIYAYKKSEELRKIVGTTFLLIGIGFATLAKGFVFVWNLMIKALSAGWALFGDELTTIFKLAFIIIGAIVLFFKFLFTGVIDICQFLWNVFGESLVSIIKNAFLAIEGILNIFIGFFKIIVGLLTGDWSMMAEGFKLIWSGLCDFLISVFNLIFAGPMRLVFDLIEALWNSTCNLMTGVWQLFTSGITALFNGFKNIFDSVVAGIQNGWQKMTDFMMILWDNSIGKMIEGIQNLASFAGDAFSKIPFVGGLFGGKSSINVNNGFSNIPSGNSGNSNTTNNYNFEVKSNDVKSMRQAYRSGRAMVLSDGGTL